MHRVVLIAPFVGETALLAQVDGHSAHHPVNDLDCYATGVWLVDSGAQGDGPPVAGAIWLSLPMNQDPHHFLPGSGYAAELSAPVEDQPQEVEAWVLFLQ